ncbi:MAG: SUMF1/EgtB/PvdO family nonheme iron enzyme, partial [Planctomycetes bacterium]|nr:SUMF1/EgtB/PvdO family nonheme iron enzyme [Planctomycetota bacterium]
MFKQFAVLALAVGLVLFWSRTQALALGDPIVIETVTIGNPGNGNDIYDGGFGGVDYVYNIGKYEVTAGQYTEFLNAVAEVDTHGLYNTEMSFAEGCMIEQTGRSGSYEYSVAADWADRPVNYVGWGDAARFANWLQNGQPTGMQDLATTEAGSYFLNGAMTNAELSVITREPNAIWVIPSENEWYKAAYYDKDSVTWNYFLFPTSSDSIPSNDLIDPDPGNNATFEVGTHDYTIGGPYWRTEIGAHENSESPYGTFDQAGNVSEWNDGIFRGQFRGLRGGAYGANHQQMHAGSQGYDYPADEQQNVGFRVAEGPFVPIPPVEPECSVNEGALLTASDA